MSQQREIGTLVVVVLKAQHLHQPSFYKQDPYAQASLSGLTRRTKVDPKGGQHPVWDDELRFPVLADVGKDRENRILEVSCYKDEQRGDDILLGKGTVDIEETLKTGEFDDWVRLETSAGARGELYLEMTFYANSPPPLTRRPSKFSPSDRLARPAAYFTQSRQSNPKSTSPTASPQPGLSPAAGDRKPSQPPPTGSSLPIPSSLIPAHGPQSQASRQAPLNGGATSLVAVKHQDEPPLPPLPDNKDLSDVGSGKNLPVALHTGGRSGSRPIPPQNRNPAIGSGRPPLEIHQPHRRTLSDVPTPHVASPLPSSQTQTSVQSYPSEITSMTRTIAGPTPSIFVEELVEDHPLLAFPTPLSPPLGPAQEQPRGVYTAGDRDSFTHGLPGLAYTQPNSQAYIPVPSHGYPRTFSPPQSPMPFQSPYKPVGPPQQIYDVSPPGTSPPSRQQQQYGQYPSGPPTSQPLSSPQPHSTQPQPQSQQPPYPPQPQPLQLPYSQPQQQQYFPLPQQQQRYHPQHIPYSQTSHPPQAPYQYQQQQHQPPGSQPPAAPQQQPLLYSQAAQQSYFTVPPPPPSAQSQTPKPYATQPPHQSQSYFSPPPPPPPPPLYNQGGQGPSIPASIAQPSQTPTPPSALIKGSIPPPALLPPQSVTPVVQSPAATPLPSQAVTNIPPAPSTEIDSQRQVKEVQRDVEVTVTGVRTVLQGDVRGPLEDVARNQTTEGQNKVVVEDRQEQLEQLEDTKKRVSKGKEQMKEEGRQQREEELRKQEELKRQEEERLKDQEAERRRWEEEERGKQEEKDQMQREEEGRRRQEEEEGRRREDEERRKQEEELRRRQEEERSKENEERRKQEEEELRRREEEERRRKEEEEHMRREEEEHRRRQEEERKMLEEEERKKQEEERIEREREEAQRRRKAAEEEARRRRAEEAEAERRWQEELAHIRARAEQEAADAAFARAQMEAEEAERRKQEEADLALVRQAQEEAEREERFARERRRQEEADMEVARREQAHEEELERRRREERRKRMEEADRELARKLDMELNVGGDSSSNRQH